MAIGPGDLLGRFKIEEPIGEGGWGPSTAPLIRSSDVTWRSRSSSGSRTTRKRARFDREARVIAALDHPAAVHVYEAGTPTAVDSAQAPWRVAPALRLAWVLAS